MKVVPINFEFFESKIKLKGAIMSPYLFFIIVLFARICFSQDTTSSDLPDETATDSKIEKTLSETPEGEKTVEKTEEPPKNEDSFLEQRIFVGLLYSTSAAIKFDKSTVTTSTQSAIGKVVFNVDQAAGFTIGAQKLKENNFGYMISFNYESWRYINSVEAEVNSTYGATTYTDKPKFSLIFLDGNLVYKSGKIYVPFGLNLSLPNYVAPISATTIVRVAGLLGAQVGFGMTATSKLSFEIWAKTNGMYITANQPGVANIEYGNGYLTGLSFVGKLFF